jgi:hypothetical protein
LGEDPLPLYVPSAYKMIHLTLPISEFHRSNPNRSLSSLPRHWGAIRLAKTSRQG